MIKKRIILSNTDAIKRAWLKKKSVYAQAEKNPVEFWDTVAKGTNLAEKNGQKTVRGYAAAHQMVYRRKTKHYRELS